MSVWKIGLCFMLSTLFCVSSISWGQEGPGGPGGPGGSGGAGGGGSGGGGPVEEEADICYVERKYDCGEVLGYLLAVDEEPLRAECGKCFSNEANELECPSHNKRAIFPTPGDPDPQVEKPIAWAFAAPDVVGGNLPGKTQITELQAVECGQKYKCFGCLEIVDPGKYPFCERTDPLPWKIKPRRLAGEDCHSYDGN